MVVNVCYIRETWYANEFLRPLNVGFKIRKSEVSMNSNPRIRTSIPPKFMRFATLLMLVAIVAVVWWFNTSGILTPQAMLELTTDSFLGPLIFILVYVTLVMSLLPTLPFNLVAGYFWGGFFGGVYVWIAVSLASIVAFVAARYLFRDWLERRFKGASFDALHGSVERHGWKYIVVARITPGAPTGPINYMFGLTRINLPTYSILSSACFLPPSLLLAYIGDYFAGFALQEEAMEEIGIYLIVLGLVMYCLFALVILFKRQKS